MSVSQTPKRPLDHQLENAGQPLKVAILGNPNTGKSTLFNQLSGGKARIGNYPGVTVEKKTGMLRGEGKPILLIDLPGTYSLAPRSLDEMVTVNVLLGAQEEVGRPDGVVCIVDATNLERNLYLVSQVLSLGLPTLIVLNMWDLARERKIEIDLELLQQRLGVPVVTTSAHRKIGLEELKKRLELLQSQTPKEAPAFPAVFQEELAALEAAFRKWGATVPERFLLERLLLDVGGYLESHLARQHASELKNFLNVSRERLAAGGCRVPMIEAKIRYAWIREKLQGVVQQSDVRAKTWSDRADRWLTHWLTGNLAFVGIMLLIFWSIFRWAVPVQGWIEEGQSFLADQVTGVVGPGPLRSLLNDGVIAGVGGVLAFLPQIMFLFFFISILEDCGYMARAAFLMDKLMTKIGLSGKAFVPLMSSFACAIPGVMATRVIENRRDRMVTILIAPLMSCSARLPVYTLMIGAFVPAVGLVNGWISLQALTLFGMVFLGAFVAVPIAWLLRKTLFRGEVSPFVMELPSYKWPSPGLVVRRVYEQAKVFVTNAGTLIFATSVIIWALGYLPGNHSEADRMERSLEAMEDPKSAEAIALSESLNAENARLLETSYLGRVGKLIEPAVRPLGWDWRIGVGVLASFPAREVIVATLGTIYSLGGEVDETDEGLREALMRSQHEDGTPVFTLPVAASIMVFFALCAQCSSTLMVIKRETGAWRWVLFSFTYMTVLAYAAAWATYQIGIRLGGS